MGKNNSIPRNEFGNGQNDKFNTHSVLVWQGTRNKVALIRWWQRSGSSTLLIDLQK